MFSYNKASGRRMLLSPLTARLFRLIAVAFVVALAGSSPGSRASLDAAHARSAARPNVLIIVTDDQRAGTMRVMPKTRRWFARGGRRYPHAFVTTPLCCPSRTSILTGLFAHNHGVHRNGIRTVPHDLMLQRYLSDAGYQTAIVGKLVNGWSVKRTPPYFDRWATTDGSPGYFDVDFNLNGTVKRVPGYGTSFMARRSVSVLRHFELDDTRPWFLYVAPYAPHRPTLPQPKYADAPVPRWLPNPAVFESDRSDKPPWTRRKRVSLSSVSRMRADQLRTLMSVDDLVGSVLRELGSLDERRNTLAVFLSDNGNMWGEHGLLTKRHPYTDSIKVPLYLRWPGHIAPGSIHNRRATNVDLAPTVVAATRVTPLTPMDGKSLLDSWTRPRLYTEYWRTFDHKSIPPWDSVRTAHVHYIQYYDAERARVIYREYYRLDSDPWELRNVFHDGDPSNNAKTRWLRDLIRRYKACSGATCP
jgi:arylsulfatase A-like enzyme